jgi:hypothetical protein
VKVGSGMAEGGGRWCSWTRQVVRDGVGGFVTTMDWQQQQQRGATGAPGEWVRFV